MCRLVSDRTMDQGPIPINPVRQDAGILILGLHEKSITLKMDKILCESHGHAGSFARVCSIDDGITLQFRHIGNAWIFNSPKLFRMVLWIRKKSGFGIDLPIINAIRRSGSTKM